MASLTELYRKRQGTSLTTCAPPQPSCSTCGMLECACRPRVRRRRERSGKAAEAHEAYRNAQESERCAREPRERADQQPGDRTVGGARRCRSRDGSRGPRGPRGANGFREGRGT